MNPAQVVEAVLFASDAPLRTEEIARADEALNEDLIEDAIGELNAAYSESERAFEIRELGEGYQLLTRPEFAPYLERFDTVPATLSVVWPGARDPGNHRLSPAHGSRRGRIHSGSQLGGGDPHADGPCAGGCGGSGRGPGPTPPVRHDPALSRALRLPLAGRPPPSEELPVILRVRTPLEDLPGEEIEAPEEALGDMPELGVDDILGGEAPSVAEAGEDLESAEGSRARGNGSAGDPMLIEDPEDTDSD